MDSIEKFKSLPGKPTSLWIDTAASTQYPFLQEDVSVDVAILGGGIAGILSAYMLILEGKRVAIVEAKQLAMDVTGNTTAKITSAHELIYDHLIEKFGKEKAKMYAEANQLAIDKFEEIIRAKDIDCNFERLPAYTFSQQQSDVESLKKEANAAKELGIDASFVTDLAVPFKVLGAVKFEDQAMFHPRKFLLSLAKEIEMSGSHIFENTRALDVEEESDHCEVKTDRGTIKAKDVIIATHYPFLDRGLYFARLFPVRSYALAVMINGEVPPGMFYDISEPYISIRPYKMKDDNLLIIGGQDHKTGNVEDTITLYKNLEKWARENFDVASIEYRWSTQDNETPDRVPYIGYFTPNSKHTFVATGFGGWGMTTSMVSSMLLKDMILGVENPWQELFNPSRVKVDSSALELAKENFQVGKHFVGDRIKAKISEKSVEDIEKGQGDVIRAHGEDIAVYKDEEGVVYAHSPKCTHLGCYVNWNNAERSWDCPCHGSRFNYDGKVIHGPAQRDLDKKELE